MPAFSGGLIPSDDGVSYLDVADAWLKHDWHVAINRHWSPMYSWWLAAGLRTLHSPYWEPYVIWAVNLAIYFFSLAAFLVFWKQLGHLAAGVGDNSESWWLVGWALFLCCTSAIGTSVTSPDLLMAAFVFLASAAMARLVIPPASWLTFLLLGFALGIGYLAKAVMFPVAFLFLATAFATTADRRRALVGTALATVAFLSISLPWVMTLSRTVGRTTFGDSGRLAYIWTTQESYQLCCAYPYPWISSWSGTAVHPFRSIHKAPTVETFDDVGGSYPPWTNPAFFWEGSSLHFSWRKQLRTIRVTTEALAQVAEARSLFAVAVLAMSLWPVWSRILRFRFVWLPACAAIGMYVLVYVESRYVAVFLTLLWASLIATVFEILALRRKPLSGFALAATIILAVPAVLSAAVMMARGVTSRNLQKQDWEVADRLHRLGVPAGSRVAWMASTDLNKYWARLAGVTIAAEVRDHNVDEFWDANDSVKADVMNALRRSSVRAVVAEDAPADAVGWQLVDNTRYSIFLLGPATPTPPSAPDR
jgi:4-amino-4-deoxy-L-arabinose transferase-like glycosyltransferase